MCLLDFGKSKRGKGGRIFMLKFCFFFLSDQTWWGVCNTFASKWWALGKEKGMGGEVRFPSIQFANYVSGKWSLTVG